MKPLDEYISESRTNPTFIAKFIKTTVMELAENPKTSLVVAQQIVDAIVRGLDQGIHEFEKKVPQDSNTVGFLMDVADQLRGI